MLRTRPWVPYLYVTPALALLALVFAYPVVRVVDFSTRLIRGASGPYVGSLNYQLVWEDPTFRDALMPRFWWLGCSKQRMRSGCRSAQRRAIAPLPSVEPSSTRSSSQFRHVCAQTLAIASSMKRSA